MSGQVRRTLLTAGGGGFMMREVFKTAAPPLRIRRPDKTVARRRSQWAVLAHLRLIDGRRQVVKEAEGHPGNKEGGHRRARGGQQ